MSRVPITAIFAASLLAACTAADNPETEAPPPAEDILTCPAYNPRDGIAQIDRRTGIVEPPVLHIEFTVDAPNPEDTYKLVFDSVQKTAPPSYIFTLERTESDVISTKPGAVSVPYDQSAFPEPALQSIVIVCEGTRFYEIEPVKNILE